MIYPAVENIRILQNATWRGVYRVTQQRQAISITIDAFTSTPTFVKQCHGLVAGDRIVITPVSENYSLPCDIALNTVYYVIASGLTANDFKVSATVGGASISASGAVSGSFYFAKPLDISGYTIDSDIRRAVVQAQVATFTIVILDAINGLFERILTPATTLEMEVGSYEHDISLTSGGGERYYWAKGVATVESTSSRN